jgi:5-methylcytosine-specific restriction endonuclease McrA
MVRLGAAWPDMARRNKLQLNEYYQTLHWQNIREERIKIDNYCCRTCGVTESEYTLHVHHLRYDLFNENISKDLITLCKYCHEAVTSVIQKSNDYSYGQKEKLSCDCCT